MNAKLETETQIFATETEPLMTQEEWDLAPTTGELCGALIFNRENPDKVKRIFPAIIYPEFDEVRDSGRNRISRIGRVATPGPGTLSSLLLSASPPVAVVDKDGELEGLEEQIRNLRDQFETCSLKQAERIYGDQLAEQRQLGPDGKLSGKPVRPLADIKNEALTRQRALNANIEPLAARARDIIAPHIKIIFSSLTKELAYLEIVERERAQNFAVLFVPSYILRCGWTLMIRLDAHSLRRLILPSQMLESLGLGIELNQTNEN